MKKWLALLLAGIMCAAMAAPAFAAEEPEFVTDVINSGIVKSVTVPDHQVADAKNSYNPAMGFDGNLNTRMCVNIDTAAGEWAIVELNDTYIVKGLDISWNNGHSRFYDVEVYTSVDGENWSVAAKRGGTAVAAGSKGFSKLPFDAPMIAKYIKIQCWGKTDTVDMVYDSVPNAKGALQSWLTFWEMKIDATKEDIVIPGTGKIVSMTSADYQDQEKGDTYAPIKGADGDIKTRVSINIDSADGEYIIAELDKVSSVTGLDIIWNNGHTRFYDVEIAVSEDGENWTVAAPRAGTAVAKEKLGVSALKFAAPVDAKYIKLTCWGKTDLADNVFDGAPGADGKVISWLTFFEMTVNTQTVITLTPPAAEAEEAAAHSCEEEWAPVTEWVEEAAWVEDEAWVSEGEWVEDDCWHIEEDNWF